MAGLPGKLPGKRQLIIVFTLLIITLLPFASMIINGGTISFGDDLASFYPFNSLIKEGIKSQQFPFWNPYSAFGAPFYADIQSSVLYPLNFIFHSFSYQNAINIYVIVHFLIASFASYLLLRKLELSREASLLGVLILITSLSKTTFTVGYQVLAWLPVILLLCEYGIASGKIKYFIPVSFLLGFQILGWVEGAFYSTFLVFIYVAVRSYVEKKDSKYVMRSLGFYFLANVLSLLIVSVQVLPFYEFMVNTVRWGAKLSYAEALSNQLTPIDAILLFWPKVLNPISPFNHASAYIGIVAVLAAVFAGVSKSKKSLPLFVVILLTLTYAMGNYFITYPVFFRLPVFSSFISPTKLLLFFSFFSSMLAAFGIDRLLTDKKVSVSLGRLAVGSVFAIYLLLYAAMNGQFKTEDQGLFFMIAIGFIALILSVRIFDIGRIRLPVLVSGITLFLLLDFYIISGGGGYAQFARAQIYDAVPPSAKFLEQDRTLYRVAGVGNRLNAGNWNVQGDLSAAEYAKQVTYNLDKLQSSLPIRYKIQELGNYNPVILKNTIELAIALSYKIVDFEVPSSIHQIPIPAYDPLLMKMMNVKYVLSDSPVEHPDLKLVFTGGSHIYLNKGAMPRAYIATKPIFANDRQTALSAMLSPQFKPGEHAVIDAEPVQLQKTATSNKVNVALYNSNEVVIDIESNGEGFLVLSDAYYPAWKATVNGKPVEIIRANHALRAIPINEGVHKVRFYYDSFMFKIGFFISVFAILFLIAAYKVLGRFER